MFATALLQHPLLKELADRGARGPGQPAHASADIPSVTPDERPASPRRSAPLDLGHRDIVHLARPQDTSTGVTRRKAFRQALEDPPTSHGAESTCARRGRRLPAHSAWALLDSDIPFTAVFAGNDQLALGALDALAERGLTCPADVSVVGFNDIPFIHKVDPPMTTIRIPHVEIGAEAARMLLEQLEDPTRHHARCCCP